MAEQKIVSVKVDDAEIFPLDAHYAVTRQSSQAGTRVGNSMQARAYFHADVSDKNLNKPANIIKLWKIATETKEPAHNVTIQYYKSDDQVLHSVKFTGWVSAFEMYNGSGNGNARPGAEGHTMLFCELTVMLDDSNFPKHTFTT
jgi:hypothetical protein